MQHGPEQVVLMENLSSGEFFERKGEEPRRVLNNISLLIKRGEVWGVKGTSLFEIKLLLEIMANITPYGSGRCVLVERGMMRHKRVILEHVFYIGSPDMVYNNMNVLEFLMFATAKAKLEAVERQGLILELLVKVGLGHLSLSPIRLLNKEEKAVVALITAAYSDSVMIVFNLPDYEFDETMTGAIAAIAAFIREKGKTLIIASQNSVLIERACTHLAVIGKGDLLFSGPVEEFRHRYDKIAVIIRDKAVGAMQDKLAELLPGHEISLKGDRLFIAGADEEGSDPKMIYQKIAEAGLVPAQMQVNPKTVQYAYEELMRQHDIQE